MALAEEAVGSGFVGSALESGPNESMDGNNCAGHY